MNPDAVNGMFELLGGLFVLDHCRALYRDKMVRGVSIATIVFFTTWGIWNLYYYPSLEQWCSLIGGIILTIANLLNVAMLLWYGLWVPKRRKR